jgi:hypothetical protein
LHYPHLPKAVGSHALGERVAALRPDVHVFGHTHFGWDMELDGVRYMQAALAYPYERELRMRSLMVRTLQSTRARSVHHPYHTDVYEGQFSGHHPYHTDVYEGQFNVLGGLWMRCAERNSCECSISLMVEVNDAGGRRAERAVVRYGHQCACVVPARAACVLE